MDLQTDSAWVPSAPVRPEESSNAADRRSQPPSTRQTTETRAEWLERAILPHEPSLRLMLRRKYPGIDTDDVLQATYLRLMAAAEVGHISNAKYYLYRAATSEIAQRARRNEIVVFETMDCQSAEWIADDPTLDDILDSKRALDHFCDALKALPPRQRAVVELRRIERLCVRATADRLATSVSSVEKLQKLAMRRLSEAMAHL